MTAIVPCSTLATHEPLAGTAPQARGWLVLEHPGPYGRVATDALGDIAEPLRAACRETGVTVLLARRPRTRNRRAWLATEGRLWHWVDVDPALFLDVDWSSVMAGDVPDGATAVSTPLLLVCTNGKRDACCAQFGRPVADALMREDPDVFESSHIGGHRLAPTALLLPLGSVHGRLSIEDARNVLADARSGTLHLTSLRGLSHLSPAGQVADAAVRRSEGFDTAARLQVRAIDGDPQAFEVVAPDARRWRITLQQRDGQPRPESCGKDAVALPWWEVGSLQAI